MSCGCCCQLRALGTDACDAPLVAVADRAAAVKLVCVQHPVTEALLLGLLVVCDPGGCTCPPSRPTISLLGCCWWWCPSCLVRWPTSTNALARWVVVVMVHRHGTQAVDCTSSAQ